MSFKKTFEHVYLCYFPPNNLNANFTPISLKLDSYYFNSNYEVVVTANNVPESLYKSYNKVHSFFGKSNWRNDNYKYLSPIDRTLIGWLEHFFKLLYNLVASVFTTVFNILKLPVFAIHLVIYHNLQNHHKEHLNRSIIKKIFDFVIDTSLYFSLLVLKPMLAPGPWLKESFYAIDKETPSKNFRFMIKFLNIAWMVITSCVLNLSMSPLFYLSNIMVASALLVSNLKFSVFGPLFSWFSNKINHYFFCRNAAQKDEGYYSFDEGIKSGIYSDPKPV